VLEKLLGYGGTSAVFLAQQRNPDRKVAVKVFLPRPNMDAQMQRDFYRRFLREAEAASQLNHPNIMPIYSYGEQDGLPYIIMPYMSGGTLSEYLMRHGPLSLQETQWYLQQIAGALDYAHEHNCVHCDVKPANILIDADGHLFLSDFGIARVVHTDDANQLATKTPDALMGTPDYISPEQAMGYPIDGRSDIYSLGITIFCLLAKRLPFRADSTIALALLHVHEAPPSLALIRSDISPAIDDVIAKALAKDPDKRFQAAGDFSAAFTSAIAESGIVVGDARDENTARLAKQAEAVFVADPAVVRIAPLEQPRSALSRPLAIGTVVLLIAVLIIFSVNYSVLRLGSHEPKVKTTPTSVTPISTDLFANQSVWPSSATYFFDNQGYHIVNKSSRSVALAIYTTRVYTNFHLSVSMSEIHSPNDGTDFYGVVFRSAPDQSRYYVFGIISSTIGQYEFWRYDGQWKSLASGPAPSISTDDGKSNTVTVDALGNTFHFAINGKSVGKAFHDTTTSPLTSGEVGLYVEDEGAEVAFSHFSVNPTK
jgi:serine/threonine protein kinase